MHKEGPSILNCVQSLEKFWAGLFTGFENRFLFSKTRKTRKWGKLYCYLDCLIFGALTKQREHAKKGVRRRCASRLSDD